MKGRRGLGALEKRRSRRPGLGLGPLAGRRGPGRHWGGGRGRRLAFRDRARPQLAGPRARLCFFRMTTSGALFPSLVPGSRGSSNKYLVEFRAGKMSLKGTTVTPDKRKGLVYIQQTDDSLIHFCWKDRTSGTVEDVSAASLSCPRPRQLDGSGGPLGTHGFGGICWGLLSGASSSHTT